MTETQISKLLQGAAPGAPGMPDLGDKVRRGHRRRRTMQGLAVAAGLVALGTPLAFQLSSFVAPDIDATPEPPVVNPAETPTPPPTQEPIQPPTQEPTGPGTTPIANPALLMPEICIDAMGTMTETPDATIPEGAARMWLCSGDLEPSISTFGAPEPFVGNLDEVIRQVNAEELVPLREYCGTGETYVWDYLVVLEYPDREPFVISTASDPCAPVVHDNTQGRGDAEKFFMATRELIRQQRLEQDYSYIGDEDLCLEARSLITQTIYDMVTGVVCGVEPGKDADDAKHITRPLPDDLFRRIQDEAMAEATTAPAHGLPNFAQTLVLSSRHGDPMTMYRWPDGSFYFLENTMWMAWTPSEALQAELAVLFEGTRTEPFDEPEYNGDICMHPNQITTTFPVETFDAFGACVGADGVYDFVEAPTDLAAAWSVDIRNAGETISAAEEPDFTGQYLAVIDSEGRVAQLYVAAGGDLVWDTDELMAQELRMRATPSAELLDWMREAGINV